MEVYKRNRFKSSSSYYGGKQKSKKPLIIIISCLVIIGIIATVLVVKFNDYRYVFNKTITPAIQTILEDNLNDDQINTVIFDKENAADLAKYIPDKGFKFENRQYYYFLDSLTEENFDVVTKANLYENYGTSLEDLQNYAVDEGQKNELVDVLINGSSSNKNAVLVLDPSADDVLVNHNYYLGSYKPSKLVDITKVPILFPEDVNQTKPEVQDALVKMCSDINKAFPSQNGCGDLAVTSSYRDYEAQAQTYRDIIKNDPTLSKTFVLPAGHSEHQLALAIDIMVTWSTRDGYKDTPQAKWINDNAYKYGFVVRYPLGKEDITKIAYEPWHLRYFGVDKAKEIKESGKVYEEYFLKDGAK